ncbi:TnsD family Tn7-like transposition protein [Ralstonia pseudosolanacearum]|uniref:TnsD family Tn7-like transposition protein n=1 Tax=Ralstonia pseudosolanacearum TaxID=1310165 RepID=UPI003394726E
MATTGRQPSLVRHCLPFVCRCVDHGELLCLADEASTYEAGMFACGSGGTRHNSQLFAACAYELLLHNSPHDLRPACLASLSFEYRRAGGRWNIALLNRDWSLAAHEGFEDCRLSAVATSDGFPASLLRAALREERPMHPAWLALLNWFIARWGESLCVAPAVPSKSSTQSDWVGRTRKPSTADIRAQRKRWLAHKAVHPGASRTELRRNLYAVWTWLYRHDREWLWRHQPNATTWRGGKRCVKLNATAAAVLRIPQVPREDSRGMPHLGTAYQLRIRLGLTDYTYCRLSRLGSDLAQQCMSRDGLALARIKSVRHTLDLDGRSLPVSVLAKSVSLREATLSRALRQSVPEERAR